MFGSSSQFVNGDKILGGHGHSLPEFSFRTFSQTIAPSGVQKSAINSPVNRVIHFRVFGLKRLVAFLRLMAERLNDVDVEIPIAGDERPKFLTTMLQAIALVSDTRPPVTALDNRYERIQL
jgi:hypothetical protein